MADRTVKWKLLADDRASAVLSKVGLSFKALGGIATAVGAYAIGREFVSGLEAAIKASEEAGLIQAQLANAIRNTGGSVNTALPQLQQMAAQLERLTGVEDDTILSGQRLLIQIGNLTTDGLERATKAAIDLGAHYGDTQAGFETVARAAAGNFRALKQLGITIGENIPKGERFNAVLSELEKRFSGQAAAELNTFHGRVKDVGTAWGNLLEKLGDTITQSPAVQEALKGMAELIRTVTDRMSSAQGAGAVKSFTLAMVDAAIVMERIVTLATNMALAYKLLTVDMARAAGRHGQPFMDTLDAMQKVHNESAALRREMEEIRRKVSEASTTPIVPGATDGKPTGPFAPVTDSANQAKTALQELGIDIVEMDKRSAMIAAAFQELGQLAGTEITAATFNAIKVKLLEMAAALQEEGGVIPGIEGLKVTAGETFLTMHEAIQQAIEDLDALKAKIKDGTTEVETLGRSIQIALKQIGVSAALEFGDLLVDAATGAKVSFGDFFKQLLRDIAKAIVQMLILKAISVAIGFKSGGVVKAQSGFLVPGIDTGRDTEMIMARPGEAVLPRELTDLLLEAAHHGRGGGGGGDVRIVLESDIPMVVRKVTDSVRRGAAVLVATELATARTLRTA